MNNTHMGFGNNHEISLSKLKKNILSIRTIKKSHVYSNVVSENIVELLMGYHHHRKWDYNLYSKLNKNDKEIVDMLLTRTGMDDVLNIRIHNPELNELMGQYEKVKNEIIEGNDDIEKRKELKHIVLRLVKLNLLPLKQSRDLLLELVLLE